MGSLVAAGGVAGACFWLPIYPVSACPLLDEPCIASCHAIFFYCQHVFACIPGCPGELCDIVTALCTTELRQAGCGVDFITQCIKPH